MTEGKQIDPEMAAKIAAIKARLAGGGAPGKAKPAGAEASGAKDAPAEGQALPEGKTAAATAAPGEDMGARIAALKAKMQAGKGPAAAATRPVPQAASRAAAVGKPSARGTSRKVWPVRPVDRTSFGDERLYSPLILNKWFLGSSVLLLLACLWMWDRDWSRDWKGWQRQFREIQIQNLQVAVDDAQADIDTTQLAALERDLEQARAQAEGRRATLDELLEKLHAAERRHFGANQDYQFLKSEFDAARYDFEELALTHGDDPERVAAGAAQLEEVRQQLAQQLADADLALEQMDVQKSRVADFRSAETSLAKSIAALTDRRDLTAARLEKIDHNVFNDYIRNAPLADMLAPTLKVDQIVLDKLRDNYNFMHVGKIDRCTTCHLGIDDPAFTNWDTDSSKGDLGQRVFNAHPRLDLFVSDSSPHPKDQFGCTVCHLGRGQAVEFPRTFHVPAPDAHETVAEKQARWVADFGFEPKRHYWDWPMVRADHLYSACASCHQETDRIAGVPGYNEPRALVEKLGCYGCHKIDGFEHLRKRGPDLTRVAAKLDESWARKWLMDPRGFRPTTRMPHFWNQSNSGAHPEQTRDPSRPWNNISDEFVDDWRVRNAVEARAVAAYVFDLSRRSLAEDGFDLRPVPAAVGDPARGRELFTQRGCLGCHSIGAEGWTANDHGPDLGSIGTKVGPRWLFNWILDPRRYFPTTVMPDLRLTEPEAWDITSWLVTLRDPMWEQRAEPTADEAILRGIAAEQLAGLMSERAAGAAADRMQAQGGTRALELFVGAKLLTRYGCAGCHLIPDHYGDKPIGTELTTEALKELSKLDFGFEADHSNPEAMPHTMVAWFEAKLRDPRVFDRLPVATTGEDGQRRVTRYDMKVKSPADKLRMPNFGLDDDDVHDVVTFLLGLREDGIDESIKRHLSPEEKVIETASRIMTARNCTGCHRLGQISQPVALDEDTLEEGYAHGLWAAAPLSADGREVLALHGWINDEIYDPWLEEDADTLEFFEEHPLEGVVLAYGRDEGGMGTYIEESALRPPVLRGEGAKVNPDWLFDFLMDPYVVRTHVDVRMPTFAFTEDEARALAQWFSLRDAEPWPFTRDPQPEPDRALLAQGTEQFSFFRCNSCHPSGAAKPSNPDPSNWGPDLALAKARLKTNWMADWLTDPQLLQPGTKMPNFLGESADGEYTPYYEDWNARIEAVVHYLRHMAQAGGERTASSN